jgi:hypothetical protein
MVLYIGTLVVLNENQMKDIFMKPLMSAKAHYFKYFIDIEFNDVIKRLESWVK